MNQKASITVLIIGLCGLLGSIAEFLSTHQTWASMTGPQEVAHIIMMLVTFLMSMGGALGVQLPRDTSKDYNDRFGDKVDLNKIELKNRN